MNNVRFLLALVAVLVASLRSSGALADEVAPDLEGSDLRSRAQSELKRLVSTLPGEDQRRLVGAYVAFDPSVSDPIAQVACDDDGDYVVVVSDAMLRLVVHLARASRFEQDVQDRAVDAYAMFVAKNQTEGRRLVPPPPGFFDLGAPATDTSADGRLVETISFVLATELERLRSRDLVCPKPTATREHGDDVWTPNERRGALAVALTIYPKQQAERDRDGFVRRLEDGADAAGAFALLRFFARLEAERSSGGPSFAPTYLLHHPGAAGRAATLRSAVDPRPRTAE